MACPKCGGVWSRQSGIRRCRKCGHEYGSQEVPITRPINGGPFAIRPVDEYEQEVDTPDMPGKINRELNFDVS